ncbi:MAG: heme biosynthesis protein HemY [Bauldia sp.]
MIRLLLLVLVVFALAAGFAWLADHPGTIALNVGGWEIATTLMAAAIALLAVVAVAIILWLVLRAIFRAPRAVMRRTVDRRKELSYQALSKGFVAVGSGDSKLASHYAAESRHYARDDPMALMLTAQAAHLAGDAMGARTAYETMLAKPETRLLGLRGLFGEARRRGENAAARSFAEEAAKEKPGIGWAGNALLEYQAAAGEWAAALETLQSLTNAGSIDAASGARLRAVLLTARAGELERGEPELARDLALEAHKLVPGLVPATVLAARLASRLGDPRRAGKVIEAAWRIEPHPELASAYMSIRPGESGRDRLRRIRQLIKIRANHLEGQIALARAAIEAKDWVAAREELRGVIATHPSERAYTMMAEIEEGEHGDIGRARDWLSRAVRAPRDPAWMADGYAFDHWQPVSPISGRIDAFEWKAPVERLPGEERAQVEAIPPVDAAHAYVPAPEPEPAAADGAAAPVASPPEPEAPPTAPTAVPEFLEPEPVRVPEPGRAVVTVPGRALFPVSRQAIDLPTDDEPEEPAAPPNPETNGSTPAAPEAAPGAPDAAEDEAPMPPRRKRRRFGIFGGSSP